MLNALDGSPIGFAARLANPLRRYMWGAIGAAFLALALVAGLSWHKWGHWKSEYFTLRDEATEVVAAVRIASDNPKLQWKDAARQVGLIDRSFSEARDRLSDQTAEVNRLGAETKRLRALNEEQRRKIAALTARRDTLIARLESEALDPGDAADCWAQIRAMEATMNALYQEGF